MLSWIVWNRTVYMYKMDLALNSLNYAIKPNQNKSDRFMENFYAVRIRLGQVHLHEARDHLRSLSLLNSWSSFTLYGNQKVISQNSFINAGNRKNKNIKWIIWVYC